MRRGGARLIGAGFEGARADYAAAKQTRFRRRRTGVPSMGSGADWHYRSEADYLRIMETARDMDRNDTIVGQTITRAVDNMLQDGLRLDANTGDRGLDDELEARWQAWGEDPDQCDLQGESDWATLERFAARQPFVDGDLFALPTEEGTLQFVEAHRCRTPKSTKRNVVHGVLLDERRRRLEYWFTKDDVDPLTAVTRVGDVERYAARDEDGHRQVLQIYHPKRVTQTRGVSALAPVFDLCGFFEDINFATLVRQQMAACFALFREREIGFEGAVPPANGSRAEEVLADGTTRFVDEIGPGMQITGQPGEKLKLDAANIPSPEFLQHMKMVQMLIGVNLGLPLCLVLLDASETNFSGFRGALDQARMGFRENQRALVRRLHRYVYPWKVRQWRADDPIIGAVADRQEKSGKAEFNLYRHRWNLPTWPYIEPTKDVASDVMQVRNLQNSPRRVQASRGRDYYEMIDETIDDNSYAIAKAKRRAMKINQKFNDGQPVHWREVVSLPTPDGVKVTLDGAESEKPAKGAKPQAGDNA